MSIIFPNLNNNISDNPQLNSFKRSIVIVKIMLICWYFPLRAVDNNCNPNIFDDLIEVPIALLANLIKMKLSLIGDDVLDVGLYVFEGTILH